MRFAAVTALSTVVAIATAAPAPQPPTAEHGEYFSIVAVNPGNAVNNSPFNAAKRGLFAGLQDQGAACAKEGQTAATFFLYDEGLYLFTGDAAIQQIFVDRTAIGGGLISYTTGEQAPPKYAELQGWRFAQGYFVFNERDLIACPNNVTGAWSLWAPTGISNPGGNSDCVGVAMRPIQVIEPVACVYTQ